MKQLIIVESPHKAKTIQKYLGNDAAVLASKGHVCDLPTRSLGIDVDNGFKPQYIVTPDKEATIKQLSQAVKSTTKSTSQPTPIAKARLYRGTLKTRSASRATKCVSSSTRFRQKPFVPLWKIRAR